MKYVWKTFCTLPLTLRRDIFVSATMFSDYEQGPKIKGKTSLYLFVIYLYIHTLNMFFLCTAIACIQIKNTKKNTRNMLDS